MNSMLLGVGLVGLIALGACSQPGEDIGFDRKKLSTMTATLWTDPNGCQHWVIDDGVEGYLSARLARDGRPVCPNGFNASGRSSVPTTSFKAVLWTDSRGCQHWVYDDGGEGFMTSRLSRSGRPVCPGASQPIKTETITLSADALFDTDQSDLRTSAQSALSNFGAKMQELGKKRVFVVGHTDSRASDAYNQRLSERRADAVAAFLEANYGIVAQTEGRGESEPVASNDTADGRQANRRVEISLLD